MKPNLLKQFIMALLLAAGCSSTVGYGQDSGKVCMHSIGLQFGLNQVKDENLHPKVSTGTITEIHYAYDSRQEHWQQLWVHIGYSRLRTSFEDLSKSVGLKLNAAYSCSWQLAGAQRWRYYLGPEAALAYNAAYLPNWDDSHLYWADYFSLGVRSHFAVRCLHGNQWITSLSIPLYSAISRPALYRLYKIDDISAGGIASSLNSNIHPAFWGNCFYIKAGTEYSFPVFQTKRESFTYSFEWLTMKADGGNRVNLLSHQLGIKIYL